MPNQPSIRVPTYSRTAVVAALGISQTLAWASSYYLPAILADPISRDIGVPRYLPFAALSLALLIAAFAGPAIGRRIDRHGGRGVLAISNLVLAGGLALLAGVNGAVALFAAWAVLGIGMALGLYDSAFAALAALYGTKARGPITGITLFAGFASTLSWPLTTVLYDAIGWRETVLVWAAINLVIALPLNLSLPVLWRHDEIEPAASPQVGWKPYREMLLLAFVFAAGWFVTGAMGGTPAAAPGNRRSLADRSDRRRRASRTGSSAGAARRTRIAAANQPARFGADRRIAASRRRRDFRGCRAAGRDRFFVVLWRRQRPSHHRPRYRTARGVRAARLWRTDRSHRRAGARGAGAGAVRVRYPARRNGSGGDCGVGGAEPRRLRGAVGGKAGADNCRLELKKTPQASRPGR